MFLCFSSPFEAASDFTPQLLMPFWSFAQTMCKQAHSALMIRHCGNFFSQLNSKCLFFKFFNGTCMCMCMHVHAHAHTHRVGFAMPADTSASLFSVTFNQCSTFNVTCLFDSTSVTGHY
jgi:hypothetical protein